MSGWQYLTLHGRNINPIMIHLNALKQQWATETLQIPDDWILENPVERRLTLAFKDETLSLPIVNSLGRVRDMIVPLSLEEQQSRSIDFVGPEPDFLAAVSPWGDYDFFQGIALKDSVFMDNLPQFRRLRDLFHFPFVEHIDMHRYERTDELGQVAIQIAACLQDIPGFFLRMHAFNAFSDSQSTSEPIDFALVIRQHGSKPEIAWQSPYPGYYDPPIWSQRREVARAMKISETHPSVIMGIVDASSPDDSPTAEPATRRLARLIEPSLKSLLNTWDRWRQQCNDPPEFPFWLIAFGLIVSTKGVSIVAHYPDHEHGMPGSRTTLSPDSCAGMSSCILDTIPFHPKVQWNDHAVKWNGPTEDDGWIRNRLRLFVALVTLLKNSRRVAAIWDDVNWPREVLDAEDALEKRHANWNTLTPSPSYDGKDSDEESFNAHEAVLEIMMEKMGAEEVGDYERDPEREEEGRQRVLKWRKHLELINNLPVLPD